MDRKELAVALVQVGVWLHPKEVTIMMDALDEDGSGEIDEDEFIVFWNCVVDLDEGKALSACLPSIPSETLPRLPLAASNHACTARKSSPALCAQ